MVSIATPTTISNDVAPSSSELTPVNVDAINGRIATVPRNNAPMSVIRLSVRSVMLRVSSRAHARNKRALPLQILRNLLLLKNHHGVEVRERRPPARSRRCCTGGCSDSRTVTIQPAKFLSVSCWMSSRNCAISPGKTRMLTAKIKRDHSRGVDLEGMNVVFPPYMRPDRTRFAW